MSKRIHIHLHLCLNHLKIKCIWRKYFRQRIESLRLLTTKISPLAYFPYLGSSTKSASLLFSAGVSWVTSVLCCWLRCLESMHWLSTVMKGSPPNIPISRPILGGSHITTMPTVSLCHMNLCAHWDGSSLSAPSLHLACFRSCPGTPWLLQDQGADGALDHHPSDCPVPVRYWLLIPNPLALPI